MRNRRAAIVVISVLVVVLIVAFVLAVPALVDAIGTIHVIPPH